ncbi:hypothetical protein F5B19DRAFT_90684 [Rostrohypoxylon terebratum]|nr:hypothetical protein F5B19DRAFT_90684 [Rostrohypoxylon terebratum]
MSGYTSLEPEHMPGSFPTDDMLPATRDEAALGSSTARPQRNKLHKPEDPRGWVNEGETARGHQHTDSGIGLTNTDYLDTHARNTVNDSAFHSNTNFLHNPMELNNAANVPKTEQPIQHETNRKPGVMTGAYSRLDENNSRQFLLSNVQDSNHQDQNTSRGVTGLPSGAAVPVAPKAETIPRHNNRNIAQDSLKQSNDPNHDDPYWGDVPYGTGTYNTVTGHGSSETSAEGSVHPLGSKFSHDQEQALPLSQDDQTLRSESDKHNGSKFTEGVTAGTAGTAAGAGAGLGLAASNKHADKPKDRHQEKDGLGESTSNKDSGHARRGSKIVSFFHRDHKDRDTNSEEYEAKQEKHTKQPKPSKDDNPLTKRDAGAALAASSVGSSVEDSAHKHDKSRELGHKQQNRKSNTLYGHPNDNFDNGVQETRDPVAATGSTGYHNQNTTKKTNTAYPLPEDTTTKSHSSAPHTKPSEQTELLIGSGLGAAGLGAGAGYALREHANRDSQHMGQSSQPIHPTHSDNKPQHGLVTGATAPVISSEKKTIPQTGSHAKSSQTNPSHRHQYYILPDGTPSGMNIGDQSNYNSDITTISPSTTHHAATKDDHTGAKVAFAGAGAAGASVVAHHANTSNKDQTTTSGTHQAFKSGGNEPYPQTAGAYASNPPTTDQQGQRHILKDTLRTSNTPSEYSGERNLTSTPATTTSPETTQTQRHHVGAQTAGATGVAGVGSAAVAHHLGKKEPVNNNNSSGTATTQSTAAPSSGATRESRSATTSSQTPQTAQHSTPRHKSHTRNRASTDSSHDGQYNVLSSGTPSGINREHLGRGSLDGGEVAEGMEGGERNQGAVHPATTTTQAKNSLMTGTGTGTGVGAGAGVGLAAAARSALKEGRPVVHRCGKCGEQNDITGYFHE